MLKGELTQQLFQMHYRMFRLDLWDILDAMPRSEFFLLQQLYKQKSKSDLLTHSQLAERLKLSNPAISRTVKQLVAKEWLARQNNEEDRRHTYLILTELGQQAYLETREQLELFVDESLEKLDVKDIETYIRVGHQIHDAFLETAASLSQAE